MITCRELSMEELPDLVPGIDVSEHGRLVYYWKEGELEAVPEEWDRPAWIEGTWQEESWTTVLGLPGVKAWGAFEQSGRMVGFIVYRPHLSEGMAQLAALFVSKSHRQQGIAVKLTAELVRQAKADGNTKLYVSATPSESAVGFYLSQGFVPTQDAHPALFELEPEDIHMIMSL